MLYPTHGVGIEEAAGSGDDPTEHGVVQVDRGAHAEDKEVDRPDHGGHHEAEHHGRVHTQVDVVLREVAVTRLQEAGGVGGG